MATRSELLFPEEDRHFLSPFLPTSPSPSQPTSTSTCSPTTSTKQSQKPHLTLTFATSLDSSLSLSPGTQTPLSGPASKSMTHYLRSLHSTILIGVGTALADDPSLNCRLQGVGGYGGEGLHGQPRPVVVDPWGRWEVRGAKCVRLAAEGRGRAPWVVTATRPSSERVKVLEDVGGEFIVVDADDRGRIQWTEILETLGRRGVESVMVEGGAGVINALLEKENAHLVDSVVVTIAPTWLGRGGVVVCPERGEGRTEVPVGRLKGVVWKQLGDDCVLCGKLS